MVDLYLVEVGFKVKVFVFMGLMMFDGYPGYKVMQPLCRFELNQI